MRAGDLELLTFARSAWPGVKLGDADIRAYLASHADALSGEDARERASDLYIACACHRGDAAALRAFEKRYFGELHRTLERTGLDRSAISDVLQQLRKLLFVGSIESSPKIADYKGKGDLAGWLRVTTVRLSWKLGKKQRREVSMESAGAIAVEASGGDPELGYLQLAYRETFASSFREALSMLDPKDRLLLKQNLLDGLTIDDLGALHGVHRATAARWLTRVREELLAKTRERFALLSGLSKGECDSILRLVHSKLDVTLRTLA